MLNPKEDNDKYQNSKHKINLKFKCQIPRRRFCHLVFVICHYFVICALSFGICASAFADEGRLNQAKMLYLKDDYSNAIIECRNILKYSPSAALKTETLYLMGLSYLKLNDPLQAQQALEEALNLNPSPQLKEKLELGLGETYFLKGETEEAQAQFKKILSIYSKTSYAPTIYFHLGHCALKLGMWEEARGYFNKISQAYPLSFEAPIAADILKNSEFYFTIQIGSFIKEENARQLYQSLKDKGYDAYSTELKTSGTIYHRVRVGKFNLKSEAQAEEAKLKDDGFSTHLWP